MALYERLYEVWHPESGKRSKPAAASLAQQLLLVWVPGIKPFMEIVGSLQDDGLLVVKLKLYIYIYRYI